MQLDMIFLTIIVPLTLLGLGFLIAISICMDVVNEIEKEENKNDCITLKKTVIQSFFFIKYITYLLY